VVVVVGEGLMQGVCKCECVTVVSDMRYPTTERPPVLVESGTASANLVTEWTDHGEIGQAEG